MCDCPYAYGHSFEKQYSINGETSILFRNDSSVREYIKPHLSFRPLSGSSELRIINKDDSDREFLLSGIPTATTSIDIDNLNGIIKESPTRRSLYSGFNMNFFRSCRETIT